MLVEITCKGGNSVTCSSQIPHIDPGFLIPSSCPVLVNGQNAGPGVKKKANAKFTERTAKAP
jgi:hypothetical protein